MTRPAGLPDLAIVGGTLLTMQDDTFATFRGSVLVRDGRIERITRERRPQARETISAEGRLVMPGFVDAHCHSIHLLIRGLSDGLGYHEWLEKRMYAALPHYTAADARVGAELFCAEAIRSGITTIADSTDFGNRADLVDATLLGIDRAGLRAIYFRNFSDAPPPALKGNRESATGALAAIEALMDRRAGRHPQVAIGPGINEPHFATVGAFRRAVALAEQRGVPLMAHVAEIEADVLIDGENVIDWLERRGLLSPRLVLAHCVWLGPEQFRKIAAAGASITWQPSTNGFLADGVMPVTQALAAGVAVGLGTDDANANDRVDMFSEMRTGALLAKIANRDATSVPARTMVTLATRGGARALGRGGEIGALAPGMAADVVLMNLDALRPFTDLASALVYQASPGIVETVVVGGRVLMHEGVLTTLDESALRKRAQRATNGILERSHIVVEPGRPSAASFLFDASAAVT
jgi:5-methylthioadenosine/S-adenosylhomocysteine deaminase